MPIGTSAETQFFICATPTTASTLQALEGLDYVEVLGVETLGEIGPQAQDVTFVPLSGETTLHLKGPIDNGATTVTAGSLPRDPGQVAMAAAAGTKFEYAAKIVVPEGDDPNDTDTIIYVRGPVMGARRTIGGAADVRKKTFGIGNNVYIEVPSEAVS